MSAEPTQLQTSARIPAFFGGLTTKQSNFIDNYLGNNDANRPPNDKLIGNGTKSAFYAGYGANLDIAATRASQLLRVRKIQEEIKRRFGVSVASPNEVLERLTLHARGDIANVLEPDGSFNLKRAKRRGASQLLKKLKRKTRYEKDLDGNLQPVIEEEFEIHDPQAALEKLGRFHKLFTEKVETEANLSDRDVDRIAQSFITALTEAASRRQAPALPASPLDAET